MITGTFSAGIGDHAHSVEAELNFGVGLVRFDSSVLPDYECYRSPQLLATWDGVYGEVEPGRPEYGRFLAEEL